MITLLYAAIITVANTANAATSAVASTATAADHNWILLLIMSLFSGITGGGVFALAFQKILDNALKKSDTFKTLVNESIKEHEQIKDLNSDIEKIQADIGLIKKESQETREAWLKVNQETREEWLKGNYEIRLLIQKLSGDVETVKGYLIRQEEKK